MDVRILKDPYDAGFSITDKKIVELRPGLSVLVGCNGCGKSTMIMNIEHECKSRRIPCLVYRGNSTSSFEDYTDNDDSTFGLFGSALVRITSSEGEDAKYRFSSFYRYVSFFIENGYAPTRSYKLHSLFIPEETQKKEAEERDDKDRVVLIDASDSGLSIDSAIELMTSIRQLIDNHSDSNRDVYIVLSTNMYELANGADCLDVNSGEYLTFKDYTCYRDFILSSRRLKEKRLEMQHKWRETQRKRERRELAEKRDEAFKQLAALCEAHGGNPPSTMYFSDYRKYNDIQSSLVHFAKHCRFLDDDDVSSCYFRP